MPLMERSRHSGTEAAPPPLTRGRLWISRNPDLSLSVLLAKSALDALSALSLHLLPAERKGCAVVLHRCCSAHGFGADQRSNLLILLDCEGSTKHALE